MPEPERIFYVGRERPGPGCRVIGIEGSNAYGGRRGLVIGKHPRHKGFVAVRWDDDPDYVETDVNIVLIEDEPVLDQMSRVRDEH